MSTFTHETITGNQAQGTVARIAETVHVWRERWLARRELIQWTERDLHDAGISRGDVLFELDKPFWRA